MAHSPTLLSGAVRSGCTQLTTSVLLTADEAAALERPAGSAAALAALLRAWQGGGKSQPWRLPEGLPLLRVVAQAESRSAALLLQPLEAGTEGGGRLPAPIGGAVCPVSLGGASSPRQQRLQLGVTGPAATTVSGAAGMFQLHCADWQQLVLGEEGEVAGTGAGTAARRVLHCRCHGRHVAVSLLYPGALEEAEEEAEAEVHEEEPACPEGGDGIASDGAASDSSSSYDSEAEAAQEARLRAALQAAKAAEAWVPAAQRQWGLYEFELAAGVSPFRACCWRA